MNTSPDELLLQKCVDGELSDAERASLLTQLQNSQSLDHWRTLAMTFVESQVLAKAFESAEAPAAAAPPVPSTRVSLWKQQIHPWASVAASLLVGALMGVGGHFWLRTEEPAQQNLAQSTPSEAASITGAQPGSSAPLFVRNPQIQETSIEPRVGGGTSRPPTPVMNVNLGGQSSGGRGVSVPVYSPEQWQSMSPSGLLTNIPEDVQRMLEEEGYHLDRERYWYRARLDDGREILVPAETVHVRPAVQ